MMKDKESMSFYNPVFSRSALTAWTAPASIV